MKQRLDGDALLDLVQRETLRYFTEFAHPSCGLARERSNEGFGYDARETVTTGGTGFGIMALIAGAERGFLSRAELTDQLHRITDFLSVVKTHAGGFAHFYHGSTGDIVPFMPNDDGGDIVETSFLMMGLLTARQYLSGDARLVGKIDALWHALRWGDYCRPDGALMWHMHEDRPFGEKSLDIRGWNECLVTYVLAAGAPNAPISPETYRNTWLKGDQFVNGKTYHGIALPLGPEMGGPLFLSQYSFLGLDPRSLTDAYADYFEQGRRHTLINRAHAIANPHGYEGYGPNCWGLSASDSFDGYAAHSPTNDLGVISPTAALSAFPFTPAESMGALRHFYGRRDTLWGPYGFRDAFCDTRGWVADSNLAIDQAPIIVMIENARSGLLWELFMSCPEVKRGLKRLGFRTPHIIA